MKYIFLLLFLTACSVESDTRTCTGKFTTNGTSYFYISGVKVDANGNLLPNQNIQDNAFFCGCVN